MTTFHWIAAFAFVEGFLFGAFFVLAAQSIARTVRARRARKGKHAQPH